MFSVPLYVFVRGVFTYVLLKQIWLPNLICFGCLAAFYFISEIILDHKVDLTILIDSTKIIICSVFFLVLLSGSSLAALINVFRKGEGGKARAIINGWLCFVTGCHLYWLLVVDVFGEDTPYFGRFGGVIFLLFLLFAVNMDLIFKKWFKAIDSDWSKTTDKNEEDLLKEPEEI